jgi:hypothetical protein
VSADNSVPVHPPAGAAAAAALPAAEDGGDEPRFLVFRPGHLLDDLTSSRCPAAAAAAAAILVVGNVRGIVGLLLLLDPLLVVRR